MVRKIPHATKPIVLLLGLLLTWLLLPAVFKSYSRAGFFEFQAPLWVTAAEFKNLGDSWALRAHSKKELYETGRDLARLNSAYELKLQEIDALRDELSRLERILVLPSLPRFQYRIARVVRRDQSSWWQQLVIQKGKLHGIPVGAAVVYSGGVVGRIREVHAYTSVVELATSPGFRMAAHFDNDERPVTYQGAVNLPFSSPRGKVMNVPPDVVVTASVPRRLTSSRLGGVFPDGLTIGWVNRLTTSPDGLFQSGQPYLDKNLLSLKEVAVLIPLGTGGTP